MIGIGKEKIRFVTEILMVFRRTLLKKGLVKKSLKFFSPTQGDLKKPLLGLYSLKLMISPIIGPYWKTI